MLDPVKGVFRMTWLWCIVGGFYLVAYAFWIPSLFTSILVGVLVLGVTLALGAGLLLDGFSNALKLNAGAGASRSQIGRAKLVVGGVVLLSYLVVYLPPGGRIVAHWPLDLAITLVAGVRLAAYGLLGG